MTETGDEIIRAENLRFSYDGKRMILDDVSFDVKRGENLVIAGFSGCGKTTLSYVLMGIIPKLVNGKFSGNVFIDGQNISEISLSGLSERIGMVFQNPDNQLVCTTVEDEVAFALENLRVCPEEIRKSVDDELKAAGISELALRNPSDLSGGQKKIVTVASVMVTSPQAVIMDEPMTGLDERGRNLVFEAIDTLHRMGKTVIVIEHDLSLAHYADRILYLKDGQLYDQI